MILGPSMVRFILCFPRFSSVNCIYSHTTRYFHFLEALPRAKMFSGLQWKMFSSNFTCLRSVFLTWFFCHSRLAPFLWRIKLAGPEKLFSSPGLWSEDTLRQSELSIVRAHATTEKRIQYSICTVVEVNFLKIGRTVVIFNKKVSSFEQRKMFLRRNFKRLCNIGTWCLHVSVKLLFGLELQVEQVHVFPDSYLTTFRLLAYAALQIPQLGLVDTK